MSQIDRTREHLIETYRKKAKHYDFTSRLYPVPGYPQRAQRLRAVQALGLRAGDTVIDIACGTGLNFPLIEEVIGPGGRIVGVDLTDAMLAQCPGSDSDERLEQCQPRASRRGRLRLPSRGRRDPVHVRPVAGARVRRGHRPRRRGPLRRRTLGRAGSQGSRQHAWVASAARNRNCAAFRLHRSSGSCAVRGRRFAQPCRKNWPISPGPSCSSEPHSSLPGPGLARHRGSARSRVSWLSARPRAISYRAALRGYQGSAHTAACGR